MITKDLASLAEDASAIALALSGFPASGTDPPLAAELADVALADKRMRATHLTVAPRLRYSASPHPKQVPRLPPPYLLRVFCNEQPLGLPGILYESMVDQLACASLGHYFPPTHQFLLRPQHTFWMVVPEDVDARQASWSTAANDGEGSSREVLPIATEVFAAGESLATDGTDLSFPVLPVDTEPYEPDPAFLIDAPEASLTSPRRTFTIPKPRVEGLSRLTHAELEAHGHLVDTTPAGLRKPDISVVCQGIPSLSNPKLVEQCIGLPPDAGAPVVEVPAAIGESKLKDQNAAVRQLIRFNELLAEFGSSLPASFSTQRWSLYSKRSAFCCDCLASQVIVSRLAHVSAVLGLAPPRFYWFSAGRTLLSGISGLAAGPFQSDSWGTKGCGGCIRWANTVKTRIERHVDILYMRECAALTISRQCSMVAIEWRSKVSLPDDPPRPAKFPFGVVGVGSPKRAMGDRLSVLPPLLEPATPNSLSRHLDSFANFRQRVRGLGSIHETLSLGEGEPRPRSSLQDLSELHFSSSLRMEIRMEISTDDSTIRAAGRAHLINLLFQIHPGVNRVGKDFVETSSHIMGDLIEQNSAKKDE
ncbi:hypothetical protein B0H16DRAFT_1452684 [Mycena metata]|uniref:Uncharacterized protein n=1 Tax=Mycena metata TaxID=1033252 RepID=A0AAD7JQ83_9AGAR|nr:hypothetical protein B0H16DRAFT_1452684 [Mycena metata]